MDGELNSKHPAQHSSSTPRSPQRQSGFFRLARELRDDIYSHAFGEEALTFHYHGLNISALARDAQDADTRHGLPQWLLTCHMICSEAMDTFLRNRYFSPRYRYPKRSSVPNSLLLHDGSIRNIKLECPYSAQWRNEDSRCSPVHEAPFRMFLQIIRPFLVPDSSLVVEWATYGQDWSVPRELATYDNWPKQMQGRFRRVEIDVLVRHREEESQRLKRMQSAEQFAKRLIGDSERDLRVSWGEEKDLGLVSQTPCRRCGYVHGQRWHRAVRRLVVLRRS
jgi:hypothetical protein